MDGAVLPYDRAAVDGNHLPVGESLANQADGFGVEVWLSVGRTEYGAVEDEEVGIGGWQSLAAVIDGARHRQPLQPVGPAAGCPQRQQLFLHQPQFLILFVGSVVTAHIEQCVVRTDAHQGVDVAVGIITRQSPVVYPYDAFCAQGLHQPLSDVLLRHGLVAMGREQTGRRGEDGALSVALDGAALQHEVQLGAIVALQHAVLIQLAVDGIVKAGRELLAPAVESEVHQPMVALVVGEGDKAVVAGPGVVGVESEQGGRGRCPHAFRSDDEQVLALGDLSGHLFVDSRYLFKDWCPVRVFVRPRQLHAPLGLPFSRESPLSGLVFGVDVHILAQSYK